MYIYQYFERETRDERWGRSHAYSQGGLERSFDTELTQCTKVNKHSHTRKTNTKRLVGG